MARYKNTLRQLGIYAVLVVVIIVFGIMSDKFLTTSNMITICRQVSMLGIAAVGMMFVMLTGGIDLSVGSSITLFNILCAYLMVKSGLHPALAVLICIVLVTCIGLFQGMLITYIKVPPLIATLAFMNILKGIAYVICEGLPINGFPEYFKILGQGYIGFVPIPVIIMVIVFIIGRVVLYDLYIGRYIYSLGGNEEAAKLSGINVNRLKIMVYGTCGFFAGIAGMLFLSRLNSGSPTTGSGFEMDVITAVVLGGVSVSGGSGKISGVIAGVLIIGMLNNGLILIGVSDYWQWIIKGIILLLAVSLDCLMKNKKKA